MQLSQVRFWRRVKGRRRTLASAETLTGLFRLTETGHACTTQVRIDPDTCRDPDLLAAEVRRLQALLDEIRSTVDAEYRDEIARLRGLLERLDIDRLQGIATDNAANPAESAGDSAASGGTSVETGIPPEWLSRPYYVDPPSGWRYGFPRLYDPATDGDMREWMIKNGYPKRLASLGLPCTFTAQAEDDTSGTERPERGEK